MNKICIVIPYFGKWPLNFNLFLKSCGYNHKSVDFLFFSDLEKPKEAPDNVIFIDMSFSKLKEYQI